VTYISVFKAGQFLEVPHFAAKHAVEEAIRAGGMNFRKDRSSGNSTAYTPGVTGCAPGCRTPNSSLLEYQLCFRK
jgi:hypothetical protein